MFPLLPLVLLLLYQKKEPPIVKELQLQYQSCQDDPSKSDEQKIQTTLRHYFQLRYEMLRYEQPLNLSFLADKKMEELYLLAYEIARAKKFALGYTDYDFFLDYIDLKLDSSTARVALLENHYVSYRGLSGYISRLKGLRHEIVLAKKSGGWTVVSDIRHDLVTKSSRKAKKPLRQFLEAALEQSPPDIEAQEPQSKAIPLTPGYYDRQAAASYAHSWALRYNPAFANFTQWGGDCTNFASQVIHAGGKPMDYSGPHRWYYNNMNDRTPSWTGVDELYNYLSNNTSGGASARVVPLSQVQPGDIVQLDFDEGTWDYNHSPVVVAVTEAGNPARILMAAHTDNRDNYPLANYAYRRLRPLKIL